MSTDAMQAPFCIECGKIMQFGLATGEDRDRWHCKSCGYIHYLNPKIVAGTLPLYEGKILLCKRAIEPRKGWWTLPAGFMELNETLVEAAKRETWEEARATVDIHGLFCLESVPHIQQVHHFFLASVLNHDFHPGPETLEIQLTSFKDLDWSTIAFPSVTLTLQHLQHLLAKHQMNLSQFEDFVTQHPMSPVFDVQPMTPLATKVSTEKSPKN